jgi:hypothetical protein
MVMAGIAAESEPVRWFGDDMTTRQALTERNVSRKLQDELLAPFLDGVVLGDSMSESWRYVSLLLRSFTRGRPATTNSGIQGLADTLLAAGGAEVQLSTTVHAVKPDRVETDHGTFHARAVINATDGEDAAWLLGGGRPEWSAQTTYWFSAPRVRKGSLFAVSNAQSPRMGFLDLASVAPGRAPKKKSLIAVSTTGSGERVSEEMARSEAARVYNILKSELHLIERTLVTRAVPRIRIPLRFTQATMRNGVYLAGDYLQTPSIQGAMVSGRRAAYAALYDLAKAEQALA